MDQWYIFDTRKQFHNYEASFAKREDADEWAKAKLGEFAYITSDFRSALVRPKSLNPSRR